MHQSVFSALSTLAIVLPAFASPAAILPRVPASQGTKLKPIAIRDFEAAAGLQRRRDPEDFSSLNLQTQSQLIYGNIGDNGQLILANMTLYAPDGLEMVLMEVFDGHTSAVDCNGDDGTISLTFSSLNAFNYALQEWAFVNESDNGTFLLIANHDGCGPQDQRQPYLITKIVEDSSTFTTYLTAQSAPWSDVAGTYDLDFGHATPYHQTPKLKERGLFDYTKSATFDVSAGTPGQVSSIYSGSAFSLDCVNCFTTGSFELTGHLSTKLFKLKELTLTASPQDFQAVLELEANITAGDSPTQLQQQKQLLSAAIPGVGIDIDGIFTLGATVSYSVGINTTFQGTASVDFGVSAGLPNSAQLVADLVNPGSSSATGFGGGSLKPLFDVKEMSASIKVGAYSLPMISFGVSLLEIGTANVDVSVKLPEVDVTLTAAYNQSGVCSGSSVETGIELDSSVDIEVDLGLDVKLGSELEYSKQLPLFTATEPLPSQCFPIDIPGLEPSKTALPTVLSTVSPSQTSVTPTHVYSASGVKAVPIVNGTSIILAPTGVSIPFSATARTGGPSITGTGFVVGPSGILASGTGRIPYYTASPPYPSSLMLTSGISSGFIPSTGSALQISSSAPSASVTASAPASSATGLSGYPRNLLARSAPLRRAATGSEDCRTAKRFGKRVLVC